MGRKKRRASRSRRRRATTTHDQPSQARRVAKYIAGTIIAALVSAGAAYLFAPAQQIFADQGKEQNQRNEDARTPPFVARYVIQHPPSSSDSQVTKRALDPNEAVSLSTSDEAQPDVTNVDVIGHRFKNTPIQLGRPRVEQFIEFSLVGKSNIETAVGDIRARITRRSAPHNGTLLLRVPDGVNDVESLGFDLDSTDLSARWQAEDTSDFEGKYFEKRHVTLKKDESVAFTATVSAWNCDCEFVFDVESEDGRVMTVTNNGKPFTVKTFASAYDQVYRLNPTDDMNQATDFTAELCDWPNCFNQ